MSSTTTRLGLYKSASDGSELVNYTTDIGQNLDSLDLAAGYQACTSSTRPSSPYSGKPIMETDTTYRTYFSNGTAPASASWVQIPNSSSTFNANFNLTSGKQINIGTSGSTASIAVVNAATTTDLISGRGAGGTASRFLIDTDGAMNWGPGGSTAPDTTLYRSAVDTLRTGDNLVVDLALTVTGDLTVGDTTWQTYVPTVANQGTATWGQRLGWYKKIGKVVIIEIYLAASGAGSGTTAITISTPSTPYRDGGGAGTTRQFIGGSAGGVAAGTNSSVSGSFSALAFAGGSGAILDRVTGPTAIDMRGENIGASMTLTIQGWYREA
jgi:hypothetical protein